MDWEEDVRAQEELARINMAEQRLADLERRVQALQGQGGRPGGQRINKFGNEEDEDWMVWKRHFQNISDLNRFNDLEKRLALAGAMTGKAALATLDIDIHAAVAGMAATIDNILPQFEARFLPAAASQIARVNFDAARQGNQETILNYHGRLRALYNRAYPAAADDVLLIRRFIMGLRKKELRMQAMRQYPANYPAALEIAQNESSVQQMVKVTELGAGTGEEPMEIGAMNPGPKTGNCHFCEKSGHWKRECELWKKAQRMQAADRGRQGGPGGRGRRRGGRGGSGFNRGNRHAVVAALEAALFDEEGGDEGKDDADEAASSDAQDF